MKYKFKAFGAPILNTLVLGVAWLYWAVIGNSYCDFGPCSKTEIFPELKQLIFKFFGLDWFMLILVIFLVFIALNAILGTVAARKERLIAAGQLNQQASFNRNIKTIRGIAKFTKVVAIIVLLITIGSSLPKNNPDYNTFDKCQPVYNPTINDFEIPPECHD